MTRSAAKTFDENHLLLRQKRAAAYFAAGKNNSPDFLLRHVAEDLVLRLQTVNRQFDQALTIFDRTGVVAAAINSMDKVTRVDRLENPHFYQESDGISVKTIKSGAPLPAGSTANLIVSAFPLHWSNNLGAALTQIRHALRPEGLFLGVLPGPGTLNELRQSIATAENILWGGISPRIDPYISMQLAGSLLQKAGFALPVVDSDTVTVRYDSATRLMYDLRAMAATNVLLEREKYRFSRKLFSIAEETYHARFADGDGRIRATFELISLSGWA